jgi:hypothetical protein
VGFSTTAKEFRIQKQAEQEALIQKQKDNIYSQVDLLKSLILWLPARTGDRLELLHDLDFLKQRVLEIET